ncbi:MAG: FlgD immunoglobulin-like domain containing protein [bacterium]
MLDQICAQNPGRVAAVQWNANQSYPLYRREAWDKWHLYPPPMNNAYYYPWLWVDGASRGFNYNTWSAAVAAAMAIPTEVGLSLAGTTYDPLERTGVVQVECRNGSADTIAAALQVVVTEDSIIYHGPNGDSLHNHVCRDYVPTHLGTPVTLAPGATDTVLVPFALDSTYRVEFCDLVVWLQNMTVQPDSSMPCWQGASANVLDYVGVAEEPAGAVSRTRLLAAEPGVFRARTTLRYTLAGGEPATLAVYDGAGRMVRSWTVSREPLAVGSIAWDGTDAQGRRLAEGVYLVRLVAGDYAATGKLTLLR